MRERLAGLLTFIVGLYLVLAPFGLLPGPDDSTGWPGWIVALFGGAFAGVGLMLLTHGTPVSQKAGMAGVASLLLGMLAFVNWGAFGPGVRECTRTLVLPFLVDSGVAPDWECRLVLGIVAVAADCFLLGVSLGAYRILNPTHPGAGWLNTLAVTLMLAPLVPIFVIVWLVMVARGEGEEVKQRLRKIFQRDDA